MTVGGIVGVCIAAAFVSLVAFMFLRAAFTRPVKKDIESIEKEPIDEKVAAEHLSHTVHPISFGNGREVEFDV